MLAIPALDLVRRRRRALAVVALALAAGAVTATARATQRARRAAEPPPAFALRPFRCHDLAPPPPAVDEAPRAVLAIEVRHAELDLAHYLGADFPGGFAAEVYTSDSLPRLRTLAVAMTPVEAYALASRLRTLPEVVAAYVVAPTPP